MAIGSLAALSVVISLPAALIGGLLGTPVASEVFNVVVIGLEYPLVALVLRRFGSVTIWALIQAILFLPLPIAGPSGLVVKIPYLIMWGILADFTYLAFRRSDKFAAMAISIIQVGLGAPLAIIMWTVLGAPQLAAGLRAFASVPLVVASSIFGALLGYLAYLIYRKLENTQVVKRIQKI
jgi:hypothetical protein